MTPEMSQTGRSLVALVRVDGHGELRDGQRVIRMHAGNPDELRGQLMERAIAIAVDEGREVALETIDLDGIYSLVCYPSGKLEQIGDVRQLEPGDNELTPEQDTAAPDGGYAQLFEGDAPVVQDTRESLHETIRLPREAMLAKNPELEEHDEPFPDIGDEPIVADKLFASDERDDEVDDEFHDEGLDRDFEDLDDEYEPSSGSPVAAAEERQQDDWTPNFTRDNRASEPVIPTPPSPETNEDPHEDLLTAASKSGPVPPAPTQSVSARPAPVLPGGAVPTLDDFLASKQAQQSPLAEHGWRARVRRATGGLIKLGPGKQERTVREEIDSIQKVFDGTRTIVVVNPKGGAHKTTATLMIAAAFGTMRGGYTLAWDNNETRGTLGWRSRAGVTTNTAVDLLRELPHFEISGGATISDIDRYVRNQGDAKFDVLASDDDAASAAIIDDDAFSRLHRVLSRFYRIMVIDTGNNMRASNWEAALNVADQLVIVSTAREDTAASAAWLADGLRERGYGDLLANAVTVLSSPSSKEDPELTEKLHTHFTQLTRAVVSVPYDQEFVGGGELNIPNLQPATREAWRHAAAVIAKGL